MILKSILLTFAADLVLISIMPNSGLSVEGCVPAFWGTGFNELRSSFETCQIIIERIKREVRYNSGAIPVAVKAVNVK